MPEVPSYETAVVRTLYTENSILRDAIEDVLPDVDGTDIGDRLQRALDLCNKLP